MSPGHSAAPAESCNAADISKTTWRIRKPLTVGTGVALLVIVLAAVWGWWGRTAVQEHAQHANAHSSARKSASTASPDAEALLLDLYDDEQQGLHQQALARAAQLTAQYPHFQLGHLVYAELLNLSLNQPFAPEALSGPEDRTSSSRSRLDALLQELQQRRQGVRPPAPAGWLPRNFLQLAADQPYAAAVDISKSRLYLFAPTQDGSAQPKIKADLYITVGLKGVGKQVEGDAKTPEGVYFIGNKPANRKLPDLYGSGALTLNYPNALDYLRGKTGSGIWLHGTPKAQYSRPPLDSDGCVVLSNADMKRLQEIPELRGAPIVIAHQLEWKAPAKLAAERDAFLPTLERWYRDGQQGSDAALKAHYSARFFRNDKNLAYWWPQITGRAKAQTQPLKAQLKSILRWKDHEDHFIVTLQNTSTDQAPWRLYWAKEGAVWKIIFEGPAYSAQAASDLAQR